MYLITQKPKVFFLYVDNCSDKYYVFKFSDLLSTEMFLFLLKHKACFEQDLQSTG